MKRTVFCVVILGWFAIVAVAARAEDVANPQNGASVQPRVISYEGNLEADDLIRVEVDHLAEWAAGNNPTKLIPYVNGLALRGNYPAEIHANKNHLHFHLQITPENRK